MGNFMGCININNLKFNEVSTLLNLEGWNLIYKDNSYIYYNKFNKIEVVDCPETISDYNDIYDFYNIEMLNPYQTIKYLDDYLFKNKENIDHITIDKINKMKYKIKIENDINENNLHMVELCFN